jgi:hypothetical protein
MLEIYQAVMLEICQADKCCRFFRQKNVADFSGRPMLEIYKAD